MKRSRAKKIDMWLWSYQSRRGRSKRRQMVQRNTNSSMATASRRCMRENRVA